VKRSKNEDTSDDDISGSSDDENQYDTERPTREVLKWVRAMDPDEQRNFVSVGMRVKVRFDDNLWYGGVIVRVMLQGEMIKIDFDDGAREVSKFPDNDIIVDDQNNGSHYADAQAFVPMQWESSGSAVNELAELEDESDSDDCPNNPAGVIAAVGTGTIKSKQNAELICQPLPQAAKISPGPHDKHQSSHNSHPYDSDEEEELGALIYQHSLAAKGGKDA